MKGLSRQQCLLIANPQTPELRIPRMRPLNDPARLAQAATVGLTGRGELGRHLTLLTLLTVSRRTISTVTLQALGACPGAPSPAVDRGDGIEQGDGLGSIARVGRGEVHGQGGPLAIGDYVPVDAPCGAVGGIRPRVGPPKTARLEALSMIARDQSIWPA
jgi:hypothetical protein